MVIDNVSLVIEHVTTLFPIENKAKTSPRVMQWEQDGYDGDHYRYLLA